MNNFPVASLARVFGFALGLALLAVVAEAQTATVNVSTTSPVTTKRKLTGYNNGDYRTAYDLSVIDYANRVDNLNLGWWRWYSGTVVNTFNWERGTYDDEKRSQVLSKGHFLQYVDFSRREAIKGYAHLKDMYDIVSVLGMKFLITVNGMTATVEEVDAMAKYCFDHGIKVDAWELSNEPELWSGESDATFYRDPADYLRKMKPFNDAIKARMAGAKTYVYYSTRPLETDGLAWNQGIKAYQTANGAYWNGVTFHSYDGANADDTFAKKQLSANLSLKEFDLKIQEYLNQSWATAPLITTELNTRIQTSGGFWFTLYDGIYLAEATLRLSKWDNFELIGRSRTTPGLISPVNDFENLIDDRSENGVGQNVNSLPHSLYLSAAGQATKLVDKAINHADKRLTTTVTGSATVSYKGGGTMDALYAQGYRGKNGQFYLCIINKAGAPQTVNVKTDNTTVASTITMTSLSNVDPAANNTVLNQSFVVPATATLGGGGGISIPAYSVARLEWTISVAAPSLDQPRVYSRSVGANELTLQWQPVDEAAGYKVSCWISGTPAPIDVGNVLTHTVSGLTGSATYNYQVTPYYLNSSSVKVFGPASSIETITISAPTAPDLTAFPLNGGRIALSWTSKVKTSDYQVTYSVSGGAKTVVNVGPVTSFVLSNCVGGTSYVFSVKASNGMGTSASSTTATVVYPASQRDVPWAGVNLQATNLGGNQVQLKWELPLSLRKGWYFENATDHNDWIPADVGTIQKISHPDNTTLVGSPATPLRDTHVIEALGGTSLTRGVGAGTSASDYLVQARVEVASWPASGKAWIFGRYTGVNQWYRFGYDNSTQTLYLQMKNGTGAATTLASVPLETLPAATTMLLGLRVHGSQITGYFDYDPILTATDSALTSGQIAITADGVNARFDRIEWYDSHMAGQTFEVWRSTSPTSGFTLRTTTAAGATSYTDTTVSGTTYYYKIRGKKAGLFSRDYSNVRTYTTP